MTTARLAKKPSFTDQQPPASRLGTSSDAPAQGVYQRAADKSRIVSALTQLQALADSHENAPGNTGGGAHSVVQRAIKVGDRPIPRTVNMTKEITEYLQKEGLEAEFKRLNDDRSTIYSFNDDNHLLQYLKAATGQQSSSGIQAPTEKKISSAKLKQGHEFAQDVRFATLYQPSSQQISETAPGAHNIDEKMMPPSGKDHYWAKMPVGSGNSYFLYQHQFNLPTTDTIPLTFGNPDAPSLIMNQGGLNLGMHIQPTKKKKYKKPIKRSEATYGGLPTVPGQVRGHAFALAQNQISTDDDESTMDTDPRTYTAESDSTQSNGGTSSWRYNQIENAAIKSDLPFTQINHDISVGAMGIAYPSTIFYRRSTPTGYDDLSTDNTGTTNYRDTNKVRPKNVGQQAYQSTMGRTAARYNPYPTPSIHKPGKDFTDAKRHDYPGYMSPPPTPFLSDVEDTEMTVKGSLIPGAKVKLGDGKTGIVSKIIKRYPDQDKTKCLVKIPTETDLPDFGL